MSGEIPRRLLIGSQGRERCGKTDWGLRSMPAPIIYIGLDFGHEGVIEKHGKDRTIAKTYINVPLVASQDKYLAIWQRTKDRIVTAILHPDARSVIIDTGCGVWELLRLAEFGKLNQVGDIKKLYPVINQEYKSLIRMAYDREVNLLVTHKCKKKYINKKISTSRGVQDQEVWDGDYERAGFGDGGYLIQVQIEHLWDPNRKGGLENKFGIRVIDCRQNMGIAGVELWGVDNNFPTLASYIFEGTDPDDWK